ncbi:MAG: hypothetical protein FWD19_03725, partial [Defluviitaleaceae bacterium]|nr:hypothetical protein [Defluviitaleaceae bacterium]
MKKIRTRLLCVFMSCVLVLSVAPGMVFANNVPVDSFRIWMEAVETANDTLTLTVYTEMGANVSAGLSALGFYLYYDAVKLSLKNPTPDQSAPSPNWFDVNSNPHLFPGRNVTHMPSVLWSDQLGRILFAGESADQAFGSWHGGDGNIVRVIFDILPRVNSGDTFEFYLDVYDAESFPGKLDLTPHLDSPRLRHSYIGDPTNITDSDIDYKTVSDNEIEISGKTFKFSAVETTRSWGQIPSDATEVQNAIINLTRETLTPNN